MAKLPTGTRKRKDGKLEKRFTVNGKRYSVYASTTRELTEKEQETREQIKKGCYQKNRYITLDSYFEEWKRNHEKTIKASTIATYDSFYNKHISAILGKRKVKDIERREILKLQNEISNKLAPTTTNAVMKVIKLVLNDAIKDNIILTNPAQNIKAIKITEKATETYHRALTDQEQKIFMQEMKNDFYYPFVALMLASGMRSGEVSALTWEDIDTNNNVIHVNKTITKNATGQKLVGQSAKTDCSTRDIPLTDTIKRILEEYKTISNILPFRTNQIFTSSYGYIIDNGTINRAIRNTLKRLEEKGTHIEHFTSHALRDTFATRYIEQGGNMKTLQKLLGHASITMTMDLYAHVLPDTMQEEMSKINIAI